MEDDKLLRLHKRKEKSKLTFYKSFLKSFPFFSAAEAKEKETPEQCNYLPKFIVYCICSAFGLSKQGKVLASFVWSTFATYVVHGCILNFVTIVAQILYENSIKAEDILDLMVAYI
uniref:Uncharacterized protein n=1 Tax=Glossina austeni TaxID=7395 RepID=A0A1A9UVY8_GLOAU